MHRNGTCIIFTHVHASCVQYTTLVVQEHACTCSNKDGDLKRYVASSPGSPPRERTLILHLCTHKNNGGEPGT